MMRLFQILWPRFDRKKQLHEESAELKIDLRKIQNAHWIKSTDLALTEARRLYEEEEERRKVVDLKATNYLLFVAALIPLLTFFGSALWGDKSGSAPRPLMLALLVVSVAYLLGFGYWVFNAIKSAAYHRIGVSELLESVDNRGLTEEKLIQHCLHNVRSNQVVNNDRLSCLNMAQGLVYRIFVIFCIMFMLEVGWGTYNALVSPKPPMQKPDVAPQNPSKPSTLFDPDSMRKVNRWK